MRKSNLVTITLPRTTVNAITAILAALASPAQPARPYRYVTQAQVDRMHDLACQGFNHSEIGRRVGCSDMTVSRRLRGEHSGTVAA